MIFRKNLMLFRFYNIFEYYKPEVNDVPIQNFSKIFQWENVKYLKSSLNTFTKYFLLPNTNTCI